MSNPELVIAQRILFIMKKEMMDALEEFRSEKGLLS